MLSHDNLIWTVKSLIRVLKPGFAKDVLLSYLPLSHVAAQIQDIYGAILMGATVYFAQPDALKGSLGKTLKEVRPTIFFGVPRVWEKMRDAIIEAGNSQPKMKRRIAAWAKNIGTKNYQSDGKIKFPISFGIANLLVFSKLRKAIGLDRCRFCVSGAAPISKETLEFFISLNIPILEGYGMSECSAPHTIALPWRYPFGTVGKEIPGVRTMLAEPDADGCGEICMSGRHVFMGYMDMEDKTKEAIDDQGWLHSGDIGKKDQHGRLLITGRIKELIITEGGENIPPVLIEHAVMEVLPCVSHCMVVGDKRKFLTILLSLKTDVDATTQEPTSKLSQVSRQWCKQIGSSATDVNDVIHHRDDAVDAAIQKGIEAANKKATSRAQMLQKWAILPRDFSISGGELGPTLKMKRQVITNMYIDVINEFYNC